MYVEEGILYIQCVYSFKARLCGLHQYPYFMTKAVQIQIIRDQKGEKPVLGGKNINLVKAF